MHVSVTLSEDEFSYIAFAPVLETDKTYFVVERVDDWESHDRFVCILFCTWRFPCPSQNIFFHVFCFRVIDGRHPLIVCRSLMMEKLRILPLCSSYTCASLCSPYTSWDVRFTLLSA